MRLFWNVTSNILDQADIRQIYLFNWWEPELHSFIWISLRVFSSMQWMVLFCMVFVWVLRNHTDHIWPSMITKNFFLFFVFLPKEVPYMVLFVGCETHYIFLMCEASFENFCMILVCVLRNHTNHIWPSMITKIFFSYFLLFYRKKCHIWFCLWLVKLGTFV